MLNYISERLLPLRPEEEHLDAQARKIALRGLDSYFPWFATITDARSAEVRRNSSTVWMRYVVERKTHAGMRTASSGVWDVTYQRPASEQPRELTSEQITRANRVERLSASMRLGLWAAAGVAAVGGVIGYAYATEEPLLPACEDVTTGGETLVPAETMPTCQFDERPYRVIEPEAGS